MSLAACRTGLLIIFLVPMGALGQAVSPEAALAAASVQRGPIPDRSAVMPILDCAKLVQHDFSTVAEAPARVQSRAAEAAAGGSAAPPSASRTRCTRAEMVCGPSAVSRYARTSRFEQPTHSQSPPRQLCLFTTVDRRNSRIFRGVPTASARR